MSRDWNKYLFLNQHGKKDPAKPMVSHPSKWAGCSPAWESERIYIPKVANKNWTNPKRGPKSMYITDLYHPYLAGLGCLFVVSWLKGATPHPSPIPVARPVRIVDLPCSTYGKYLSNGVRNVYKRANGHKHLYRYTFSSKLNLATKNMSYEQPIWLYTSGKSRSNVHYSMSRGIIQRPTLLLGKERMGRLQRSEAML